MKSCNYARLEVFCSDTHANTTDKMTGPEELEAGLFEERWTDQVV